MIAINQNSNNRLLNEIVEAFEATRSSNSDTQIDSFLPEKANPEYARIAVELMRVDLEHSWRDGVPKSLEDYRRQFTEVLSDDANLRQLAYEDYRQRLLSGETIRREDYRQFGVDTNNWPDETRQEEHDDSTSGFGTLEHVSSELDRLIESIQDFPLPGHSFGPYEIVAQIGQGAFARVYLAHERELADRLVVLKVGALTSIEHQRLARLQHTNIVPIYSVQTIETASVICMPFFGLSTLSDVLQHLRRSELPSHSAQLIPRALADKRTAGPECTAGPVSASAFSDSLSTETYESACVSIMRRVADALSHANERGILHRDLKPANILLSDDGQPMLLDFNVSDDVVPGGSTCLTVGGTLPYMSPEQLRSVRCGSNIDARSDIYSFGVVFYELLTGVHPFKMHRLGAASTVRPDDGQQPSADLTSADQSIVDNVGRVLAERESSTPDIRRQNPRISNGLANIVAKCLQPDPADRYLNADQLREDLRRHEQDLPLLYTPRPLARERIAKWCRRHPKLTSGSTVTAAAIAIVLMLSAFTLLKIKEVGESNALLAANELHQKLPNVRGLLTSPTLGPESISEGYQLAYELLETADLWRPANKTLVPMKECRHVSRLDGAAQRTFRNDIGELTYLLAHVAQSTPFNSTKWETAFPPAAKLNQLAGESFGEPLPAAVTRQRMRILHPADALADDSHLYGDADRLESLQSDRSEMLAAIDAILNGQATRAIPILEASVRREPLSFSHRLVLANAYVSAGRMHDAEESYTVCVSMNPDSYLALFTRGQCRLDMGLHSAAETDFTSALVIRPSSVEALINRGLARQKNGQLELAEADLTSAIRIEASWPRVYLIRSRVRAKLRDEAGAKTDLEHGLTLPPLSEKDWIARGIALLATDSDAAFTCFEQALQLNPLSRSALRNMAHVISEHRRESEAAMEMLDRIVEISPGHLDDVVSRAVLNARLGRWNDATTEIERVLNVRRDGKTVFQAACVYALLAEGDNGGSAHVDHEAAANRAIALVAESVSSDPRWLKVAIKDPDLATIRGKKEFRAIVLAAMKLQRAVREAQENASTTSIENADE